MGLALPPPMQPIASGATSRKAWSRSCHWRSSSARCTSTRVLTLRHARIAAATTVFPKAVGACSTPKSWHSIAATAASWSSRSWPVNTSSSDEPFWRSSTRSKPMPCSCSRVCTGSRQPRGRAMCWGKFSAQPITRGLSHTDRRIAWAL